MAHTSHDPTSVLDRAAAAPDATIELGPLPENVVDIWSARGGGHPKALVILIHGGFWRATYDRRHLRPMSLALAELGYTVATVEYRRRGRRDDGADVGWTATLDDVRLAVREVPGAATALSAPATSTASTASTASTPTAVLPTVLAGHSAGGQLALWAAAQATVPELAGVLSLAGVCDLARAHELRLGAQGDDGAVDAFLGGGPLDVPERYAAADPMALPLPDVPVVLVHGAQDRIVPPELSRRYAERGAGSAGGGRVEFVELPGVEHFGPIDPLSSAWGAVTAALNRLSRG